MMHISRVVTENPIAEQWRLLSQYSYPSNIHKFLSHRGFNTTTDEIIDLIAGSIRQSQAYFDSAASAPLDISPLLLYYGATNLLMAASTMLTNSQISIDNHGMIISKEPATRLADVQVIPRNANHGGLQQYTNVFSNGCDLVNGDSWSLGELIGSIPDLKSDFENHYQDLPYFTIPVETVITRELTLDRVHHSELQRYESPEKAMNMVTDLRECYLPPQYKQKLIVLQYRRGWSEIGIYSTTGRKYLQLAHSKRNKMLSPHPAIIMYMGLYILGFLPRYRPQQWNPFVQRDVTGEKLIIEKFVDVCKRYFPNLMLEFLFGHRIQFVNEPEGIMDLSKTVTREEIENMVKNTLQELKGRGVL